VTLLEILQGANVALHILAARAVLVLAMLLTAGFFAAAMALQTQLGAIIAATWAILVFLPVLYTGGKHAIETQHQHAAQTDSVPTRTPARAA
jgi:hypothetical protein